RAAIAAERRLRDPTALHGGDPVDGADGGGEADLGAGIERAAVRLAAEDGDRRAAGEADLARVGADREDRARGRHGGGLTAGEGREEGSQGEESERAAESHSEEVY